MREAYLGYINNPTKVEAILLAGAAKARAMSQPFMTRLRHAVGLRPLGEQGQRQNRRDSQGRQGRPAHLPSSTARAMGSSTSSWSTVALGCCCKARASLIPKMPQPAWRDCETWVLAWSTAHSNWPAPSDVASADIQAALLQLAGGLLSTP
ncbi:MAG: hypothetical protein IPO43_14325 [Rhodoferax sp.]|nr:hypothetical protein [Rhodoferax sp.]